MQVLIILSIMAVSFIVALFFIKLSPELSIIIVALAGLFSSAIIFSEWGDVIRHFVEGSTTFLDIMLTVIAATLFMNICKELGILSAIMRSIVLLFSRSRTIIIIVVMLFLLLPGALTGAGSVSVLISGDIAAIILGCLGVPILNIAGIIFIGSVLSVAAPPVNIYAMIMSAGVNMPYTGFFVPLIIPTVSIAIFSGLFLARKGTPLNVEEAMIKLPKPPDKLTGFMIYLPFIVLIGLMVSVRIIPHLMPVLGVPLQFIISTIVAVIVGFLSGIKINIWKISLDTISQLFSLLAVLVAIGILIQVMSLTGVRGLFVITILTMPVFFVYLAIIIGLPIGEAILLFGVSSVLGVPLVLYFSSMAKDAILVTAAISLIAPLGDALPPTALIGRLITSKLNLTDSYGSFLKKTMVPWVVITITALAMIFFA